MAYDGDVKIRVSLDNSAAKAGAKELNQTLMGIAQSSSAALRGRSKAELQSIIRENTRLMREASKALDQEYATLSKQKAGGASAAEMTRTETAIRRIKAEMRDYAAAIREAEEAQAQLNAATGNTGAKAAGMAKDAGRAASATNSMGTASARTAGSISTMGRRIKEVFKSVFVFSVLSSALRSLQGTLGGLLTADAQVAASLAQIRGALGSAFSSIWSAALPAIRTLVSWLAALANALSKVIRLLFGSGKAADMGATAIGGAGGAAKEAASELAKFDEINQMTTGNSAGGGGGGGGGGGSLGALEDTTEKLTAQEKALTSLAIGTAGYSILKKLGFVGGGGIIGGGWKNGFKTGMKNLSALVGSTLLANGVLSGYEVFRNVQRDGFTTNNELDAVLAAVDATSGAAFMTGNPIGAIVGTALQVAKPVGTWLGGILSEKYSDDVAETIVRYNNAAARGTGINKWNLSGYLADKGLENMWARPLVGLSIAMEEIPFIRDLVWWNMELAGGFGDLQNIGTHTADMISNAFNGAADTIKTAFKGTFNYVSGLFKNDEDAAKKSADTVSSGVANTLAAVNNQTIDNINAVVEDLKKVSIGGVAPFGGLGKIERIAIPKLAQGAVIPANREFLAVLGDQTSGTNVEAPVSTIEDAVRRVLNEQGGGTADAIRSALSGMAIKVDKRTLGYIAADAINGNRRAAGKLALNL